VREPVEPGVRRVTAVVRRASSTSAGPEVSFPLPDPETCVRLLRDPFGEARGAAPGEPLLLHARPVSNLVFSDDARRLYVRVADGAVVAIPVPQSMRAQVGKPRVLRVLPGRQIIAVGAVGKSHLVASARAQGYSLHVDVVPHKGRGGSEIGSYQPVTIGPCPPEQLGVCLERPGVRGVAQHVVVLPSGALYNLAAPPHLVAGPTVTACARVGDHLAWVTSSSWADTPRIHRCVESWGATGVPRLVWELGGRGDLAAFFGWGGTLANHDVGLLAVRAREGTWTLKSGRYGGTPPAEHVMEEPEGTVVGAAVLGCEGPGYTPAVPGLVVLDPDRHALRFVNIRGRWLIQLSRTPIRAAACTPAAPLLAYTTDEELVVVELATGRVRLRLRVVRRDP
jgi:hypothetical protein